MTTTAIIKPNLSVTLQSGARDSVVMGVWPVTTRSLVQTLLWSLDVVCCAMRQGMSQAYAGC